MFQKNSGEISALNDQFFNLKDSTHEKILKITTEITEETRIFKEISDKTETELNQLTSSLKNMQQNLDEYHLILANNTEMNEKLSLKLNDNKKKI